MVPTISDMRRKLQRLKTEVAKVELKIITNETKEMSIRMPNNDLLTFDNTAIGMFKIE